LLSFGKSDHSQLNFPRAASVVIGRRVLIYVLHQEEHFVKVRIRPLRWASCLLLTNLFLSLGCSGDPQYGVVTKPKDPSGSDLVPVRKRERKNLPKNQFDPETLKSNKLRGE
jgi:hypothetical protein